MRFYKSPRTFVEDHLIDDDKERLVLCRLMMRPCFVIGSNPMVRQFLCGPPQHTADDPPEQHNNGKWAISFNWKQSIISFSKFVNLKSMKLWKTIFSLLGADRTHNGLKDMFYGLFGPSILFSEDTAKVRDLRQILVPLTSPENLQNFEQSLSELTDELVMGGRSGN